MLKSIGMAIVVMVGASLALAADLAGPTTRPGKLDLGDGVSMALVRIPPGKFLMGSPDTEKRIGDDEAQHEVTISKAFYIGMTEVTQEQYITLMRKNPSRILGKTNPVDSVTWDAAAAFCKKLSEKTGKAVRLPTEAEWEYACRAGTTTRFSFGNEENDLGKYSWNRLGETHPVGTKLPNAWGLYDMQGNVWEWCSDWYRESYPTAPAVDPTGPEKGALRVLRGGCWRNEAASCRSACRTSFTPDFPYDGYGLRIVVAEE